MIDLLLIALLIAAAVQKTSHGRAAACTFAGLTVAFDLIQIPAELYHLSAALTDGVCVFILSQMAIGSGMVRDLQRLCLLSIVLNFAGWVCYEMYIPSTSYNLAFLLFYSVVVLSLIMRRIGDAHGSTTTYRSYLPFYFYSSFISDREQERGC